MLMGRGRRGTPIVLLRGSIFRPDGSADDLIRSRGSTLFR
jgi:F420-0:gamma-glutamyl ligase